MRVRQPEPVRRGSPAASEQHRIEVSVAAAEREVERRSVVVHPADADHRTGSEVEPGGDPPFGEVGVGGPDPAAVVDRHRAVACDLTGEGDPPGTDGAHR